MAQSQRRLSRLILLFAVVYVLLILCPDLFNRELTFFRLLKNEDALTILSPLALIPLYWLMHEVRPGLSLASRETVLFLIVASAWACGHGMHWSANAIGRWLPSSQPENEAYRLTYFIDEVFSHYYWAISGKLLTVLVLIRQWKHPFPKNFSTLKLEGIAAALYGISHFLISIEGQTTPIGIPFAVIVAVIAWQVGLRGLRKQPLLAFYGFAYAFSILLFFAWGLYWKGFPELSAVGLL